MVAMLSDDMRKRIAGLNKGTLRHRPKEPVPETGERAKPSKQRPSPEPIIRYRTPFRERTASAEESSAPETHDVRMSAAPSDAGLRVSIEEAAGGREIRNEAGRFLLIERSYQDFVPGEGRAAPARPLGCGRRAERSEPRLLRVCAVPALRAQAQAQTEG